MSEKENEAPAPESGGLVGQDDMSASIGSAWKEISARMETEEAPAEAKPRAEDGKFAEKAPEFSDPKTAKTARDAVVSYLKDVGFTDDEVNGSYTGKHGLSLRDHRASDAAARGLRHRRA